MLVVKNIKIQFQKSIIPIKIKKILIGYKQTLLSNKRKFQQTDSHTFQWWEDITLPLYYNVPLSFNCKVDEDLYNPQDPNCQLSGQLKIVDYKASMQQGVVYNKQNRKVAGIVLTYRVSNEKLIIPQEKGVAVISSILAHINNQSGSQGFIEINLDNKQIFTPTVKVIAGELLWAEELLLPIEQLTQSTKNKHQMAFSVYIDQTLRGKGSFSLTAMQKNNLKYKKFDIFSLESKEKIGTIFIDVSIRVRNNQSEAADSKLRHDTKILLIKQRKTQEILSKRQPSQNFFKRTQNPSSQKNFLPVGVKSSRSESKLPHHGYNAQQTTKILQKYANKKRKKYEIFDQIFEYGSLPKKQQEIRQVLRDRRKKVQAQGSFPKLR